MKKIYIQPLTNVEKINVEQMICASPDGYNKAFGTTHVSGNVALDKEDFDEDVVDELW